MRSYYTVSNLKKLEEWRGDWNMIIKSKKLTIERIKEIIKEEFRVNLYEQHSGIYMSKSDLIYVNLSYPGVYVSINSERKGYSLEVKNYRIINEKELLDLIKKFKKLRAAL